MPPRAVRLRPSSRDEQSTSASVILLPSFFAVLPLPRRHPCPGHARNGIARKALGGKRRKRDGKEYGTDARGASRLRGTGGEGVLRRPGSRDRDGPRDPGAGADGAGG